MFRKTFLILTALCLIGCAQNGLPKKPEPQKMQVEKVDKALQKGEAKVYLCKDDKQVRVVHSTQKKRKKLLHHITVTFNSMSEKLTLMISERGKNYGNIRWAWQERDDFSVLKTNLGEVLAEQCVLQPVERLSGN